MTGGGHHLEGSGFSLRELWKKVLNHHKNKDMGVSINDRMPKWMVYKGKSY